MILWVILILIGLIVVVYIWWTSPIPLAPQTNDSQEDLPIPTMHSFCDPNRSCGGDLVCDSQCHRCKMKAGGDCAGDGDCDRNFRCHDWKCILIDNTFDSPIVSDPPMEQPPTSDHRKHIQWELTENKLEID